MLVCPHCQFENPNTNNFCQNCGNSLTHKNCPQCGARVPLGELHCHECKALTGQIWRAIVLRESGVEVEDLASPGTNLEEDAATVSEPMPQLDESPIELPDVLETQPPAIEAETVEEETPLEGATESLDAEIPEEGAAVELAPEEETERVEGEEAEEEAEEAIAPNRSEEEPQASRTPEIVTSETEIGAYLDAQRRYRLLEPMPLSEQVKSEIEVKVLDCQPLQQSPLIALNAQPLEQFGRESFERSLNLGNPGWTLAIPELAKAHLALHSEFYPLLSGIHDAWQQDDRAVLLLEDRSHLPQAIDRPQKDTEDPLQILHWLQEMSQLWAALEPWNCCQTLLERSNLRVDAEDELLCLQRLYADDPLDPPTLPELGRVWQTVFIGDRQPPQEESGARIWEALTEAIDRLEAGEIETIAELQITLDAIGDRRPAFSYPFSESEVDFDNDDDADVTMVMPMRLVSLEAAGATDIGRQRTHNEDDFGLETQHSRKQSSRSRSVGYRGTYILCDGMGGHAGGEIASALAVETLQDYFKRHWRLSLPNATTIRDGVLTANQAIYQRNQLEDRDGSARMGTTLVMVLVQEAQAAIAHVGDSRLYRFTHDEGLEQLTLDHEVGQREIQRGIDPETAYSRPDAYQLTQALGPRNEDFVRPDVAFLDLSEDTLFILASDGLTDNDLLETHTETHVAPLLDRDANLDRGVRSLIDLANTYNGHDNITAIVVRALVESD
ncbi:serine/threonine phosphatase [Oxynema aestuarii]|uniref:Serine/threonine phosphatase n=1 Tax=Oxynema aestuarii AP17 TaxID=2064643 RepID=A0A6H1TUI9_9CYAN|nr:serine/threonine phosphatase [Oxynema aestuarii]QIZ70274.1 serine/threonine phosphatase [Oxynema aestuarii AP17]